MSLPGILGIISIALFVIAIIYKIVSISKLRGINYSWLSFKNHGLNCGLIKNEIKLLRDMALSSRLPNAESIYSSARILDKCILKTVNNIKTLEISEDDKHNRIEEIFLLRSKMDSIFSSKKHTVSSTLKLKDNLRLDLHFDNIGVYSSQILENTHEYLSVEIPAEALDTQEFTWKGKKVKVIFYMSNDAEYNFTTKVINQAMGTEVGMLHISHTNKLTRLQKRIFKRNNANISVDIFTLKITQTGATRKISIANPTPFHGLISNISAGGVAIRAGGILKDNTLIKLNFSLDLENTESVIGRVLAHTSVPNSSDKMLHIRFERINKKTRNAIFEYIYHENKEKTESFKPKTFKPTKDGKLIIDPNN